MATIESIESPGLTLARERLILKHRIKSNWSPGERIAHGAHWKGEITGCTESGRLVVKMDDGRTISGYEPSGATRKLSFANPFRIFKS